MGKQSGADEKAQAQDTPNAAAAKNPRDLKGETMIDCPRGS
jgi:hypothetical protein